MLVMRDKITIGAIGSKIFVSRDAYLEVGQIGAMPGWEEVGYMGTVSVLAAIWQCRDAAIVNKGSRMDSCKPSVMISLGQFSTVRAQPTGHTVP